MRSFFNSLIEKKSKQDLSDVTTSSHKDDYFIVRYYDGKN